MERRPDRFEQRVRLGCGFVAGVLLGFLVTLWAATRFAPPSFNKEILGLAVAVASLTRLHADHRAVVFAMLARRHGDRFWHALIDYIWPWGL